jgi:hypothetical protein
MRFALSFGRPKDKYPIRRTHALNMVILASPVIIGFTAITFHHRSPYRPCIALGTSSEPTVERLVRENMLDHLLCHLICCDGLGKAIKQGILYIYIKLNAVR